VFTYKIDVLPPVTSSKNHPPSVSTVSPVQALVGMEYVLPILAVDRNGDALTIKADEGKGAFALGAVYDESLGAVVWTPVLANVGKTSAKLHVSDGKKKTALTIKIEVNNALIFGGG
jgi:hypothetical protein